MTNVSAIFISIFVFLFLTVLYLVISDKKVEELSEATLLFIGILTLVWIVLGFILAVYGLWTVLGIL